MPCQGYPGDGFEGHSLTGPAVYQGFLPWQSGFTLTFWGSLEVVASLSGPHFAYLF